MKILPLFSNITLHNSSTIFGSLIRNTKVKPRFNNMILQKSYSQSNYNFGNFKCSVSLFSANNQMVSDLDGCCIILTLLIFIPRIFF